MDSLADQREFPLARDVNGSGDAPRGGLDHALPAQPVVEIRPSRGWVPLDVRTLWAYRELLFFLAWRDIKVRYKQAVLGAAWAIIQPLATMLIFTLIFGRLAGMPSDGIPYPVFAFAGLLPWTFFANAVTGSSNSLIGNAGLISKVYFPRMIIPGAAVAANLVDFGISTLLLAVLLAYYAVEVTWSLLLFPVLVLHTAALALAVGMATAALNVKYRDVRHALPFLVQLGMFASPIIYPATLVPPQWRWLLNFNPLSGLIESFRACLFGRPIPWAPLGLSAAVTLALLVSSAYLFRRLERSFADEI